jgi:hypothetical protein
MRTAVLALIGFVLLAGPTPADDGFKPLFNGKNLSGWKPFLGDSKVKPEEVWTVADGVLVCKGKPAGYIITNDEFANYTLRLQWRFPATSKGGNSGVLLHTQAPDKIWPKAVEAQLQTGRAGDFWLIDAKMDIDEARRDPNVSRHYIRMGESWAKQDGKDKKGRDTFKLNAINVEKPMGEWNQYEIVCQGGNIRLTVNGQLVNEGKILLQSEGAEIHFRNIEIKTK